MYGQIEANARKNVVEGFVPELWSHVKINVNLRKKIVTNLSAIGQNASLLENVNVQKSINVSDRPLNQSNVALNAKVTSQIPGENGQIGQIVQNHVQPMEKEVLQLEHENVMEPIYHQSINLSKRTSQYYYLARFLGRTWTADLGN